MNRIKKILKKIISIIKGRFWGYFGVSSKIFRPFLLIRNKKHIYIGNNVIIRQNARIEPVLKWGDVVYNPKLIIEDDVCIEQNVHIACSNKVLINKGCLISSNVFITDLNHEYKDINLPVLKQPLITSETIIEENCFLGSGVKIMAGVHLGKHCVVGSNSVVTKSFPNYCVLGGIPAKIIKKYNPVTNEWEKE